MSITSAHRSNRARRVAAGALALIATGALFGCSTSGGDQAATAKQRPTASTTVADQPADLTDAAIVAQADEAGSDANAGGGGGISTGSTTGGGGTDSGGGGGQPTTPPPSSNPAPTITSFVTPEDIDCHNGNAQFFTASWSTNGASKVTISVDGPGIYDTYAPSGETSLPFSCSTPHTYLLTAIGPDGQRATQTITLQPRNVQPPMTDDDDTTTTTTTP